ncbi:response regulator transcription factor [Metabacillus bambusae]|uniref:AraC family transcriptional regulator n=1 Tax=Metabacillus bambusae TaxID=2795218 RepID=A0ABS3N7I9_9BACI|nr:response regulator transcription factor [Metabacillus bambusae]MBO1514138.1 AraC family transcriptional regulator [Metabacillus bambusae]
MDFIQFHIPPFPHYINCGTATCQPGEGHSSRKDNGVFDLIFVTTGTLYIEEDGQQYAVEPGKALLLNPVGHHFSYQPCTEHTHFYWLHFTALGKWKLVSKPEYFHSNSFERSVKRLNQFTVHIPKFHRLTFEDRTYSLLQRLILMMDQDGESVRWKEQSNFQDIFQLFKEMDETVIKSAAGIIAEKAAMYLRGNYQNHINYSTLGKALRYNPTYISRCMQKVFNCTPLEYLTDYRIEKAKLLLINTDKTVSRVAEEVGFNNISYFIKCFTNYEKITPKLFTEKYRSLTTHRWDLKEMD